MPIRFRCAYCNQLMGIARRKAGTVVSCPTCQGQVVVPVPDPSLQPLPMPLTAPQPAGANVFEQQDFDPQMFNANPALPAPAQGLPSPMIVPAPMGQASAGDSQPFFVPPLAPRPPGFVLTSRKLIWLLLGGVVLGLLLFGLGVMVGKSMS